MYNLYLYTSLLGHTVGPGPVALTAEEEEGCGGLHGWRDGLLLPCPPADQPWLIYPARGAMGVTKTHLDATSAGRAGRGQESGCTVLP